MNQRSIGYYTPWGNPVLSPDQIEWAGLTDLIYWGAAVHADGTLDLNLQLVSTTGKAIIAAAHAKGVKVLLGLIEADWAGGANTMQPAVTNKLSTLVANVMSAVNSYGFDGVDIDWEPFNSSTSGAALKQLAGALRAALGTKLLSVAAIVNDSAYWGGAHSSFDRIQMMTYDLGGLWNPYSWHNAALYGPSNDAVWSVDLAVRRFLAAGVPAGKLCIGIPFYGWQNSGGGVTKPGQPWGSASQAQKYYQNLGPNIAAGLKTRDALAHVPYVSGPNSFLTYDDENSVAEKVTYAIQKGLGGWIIWELVGGYIPTQTPNQPLLDAIRVATGGVLPPPPPPPPPPPVIVIAATAFQSSAFQEMKRGSAYDILLSASGGTAPYIWQPTSGVLPAGLSLNPGTGHLSGIPSSNGFSSFTIMVTDAKGFTLSKRFNISVVDSLGAEEPKAEHVIAPHPYPLRVRSHRKP